MTEPTRCGACRKVGGVLWLGTCGPRHVGPCRSWGMADDARGVDTIVGMALSGLATERTAVSPTGVELLDRDLELYAELIGVPFKEPTVVC